MKRTIRSSSTLALAVLIGAGSFTGCSRLNQTERGTIIGATGGAVIGGVIGKQVGSTAAGAIVGAAVGGTAGAVIGRRMDRQAEELSQEVEGATVQRIGEGIAITFDGGLLFPFDSDQLLPRGRTNIAELAESLRRYPDTEVLIVGGRPPPRARRSS